LAAAFACVAVLATGNALFEIAPRHDVRRNAAYQAAQRVIANAPKEEIALVRGDDITGLYLKYWGDRQIVYVDSEAESLAETLSTIEAARRVLGTHAPRLLVVDSDPRRAGWWHARLEAAAQTAPGRWFSSTPDWQAGNGLVMELISGAKPE